VRVLSVALSILFGAIQIDHIIARQHGSRTELDNLALACVHCNRFKGPNVAGLDPDTNEGCSSIRS
jgi:5-methylcytosine-specific restriction endonuclease McrA